MYGTAEDEQGVGSAMTRQRRGWRGAGELCWWMQDRMMSVWGREVLERAFFWFRVFPLLSWFYPGSFSFGCQPMRRRRESNLKRGSYSSIFIDREAYLRPPVLFTQVTAIPSDSDGSPIMSSLSLIVSDVGHQGSFEGRFDYLLRRNGRQNPGPSSAISTSPTSGIQRV